MDGIKEQKLFDKYPKIFRQKDLSPQDTSMCWGISCGDGWYWLIDTLCGALQRYVDSGRVEQVEAVQVKQKFGGLRFYVDHANDEIFSMIYLAEHMSYKICESCGSTKDGLTTSGGYVRTICKSCLLQEEHDTVWVKEMEEAGSPTLEQFITQRLLTWDNGKSLDARICPYDFIKIGSYLARELKESYFENNKGKHRD